MATLPKLKVFENGGMIQFATLTDELITSEPKGTVRIKKSGDGFSFEKVETGASIAAVVNFSDVLDSAGVVYGADFDAVLTALSFFFELASGGGDASDVSYDNAVSGLAATDVQSAIDELAAGAGIDTPYATAQWHSFTENYDSTTTRSLDANFLIGYQVLIKKEVTISSLAARYTAGIAGACVVGVYSTGANGHPNTKLFQSAAAFNNASTGVQQVSLLGGNAVLPAGLYWVLYLSSSTPTAAALNQNIFINTSGYNSAMTAPNSVWFRGLTYTATLPATAGAGTLGNNGGAIPFFTFLTV
jgi:hypothetical protein